MAAETKIILNCFWLSISLFFRSNNTVKIRLQLLHAILIKFPKSRSQVLQWDITKSNYRKSSRDIDFLSFILTLTDTLPKSIRGHSHIT